MSVTLKQRTYANAEGQAVGADYPGPKTLVGPAGAKVSDEQARLLGLENGAIPQADTMKSAEPSGDKSYHGEAQDKGVASKKKAASKKKRAGTTFGGGDS